MKVIKEKKVGKLIFPRNHSKNFKLLIFTQELQNKIEM